MSSSNHMSSSYYMSATNSVSTSNNVSGLQKTNVSSDRGCIIYRSNIGLRYNF
jgi:hypothetical protein